MRRAEYAFYPCNRGGSTCYEAQPAPRPSLSTDTREPRPPQAVAARRSLRARRTARGRPWRQTASAPGPAPHESFWRRNARSVFQWPRRSPGRAFSSCQTARRADRGDTASAPAVRRHDEQPDRLQHLLFLRRARLLRASLQFSRRRPLAGRLRSRSGRIVGRGVRARLGAIDQSGSARVLDRRRFVRRPGSACSS